MAVTAKPGGGVGVVTASGSVVERLLEEATLSGELRLSGRKLKELPRGSWDLADIVRADLSRNQLSEWPEQLAWCVCVETLVLSQNSLRRLPDSISALVSLTHLDLSGNQLRSVPRALCSLPLHSLLLGDNQLESLPAELGRLRALAELDVARNRLAALPLSVGDLAQLRVLRLEGNLLALLPLQVTWLRLTELDVSCNCISSLPLELRHMTSLLTLRLHHNPLVCPPSTVCMRGRVHIFKYLEVLASKEGGARRTAPAPAPAKPVSAAPPLHTQPLTPADYYTHNGGSLCSPGGGGGGGSTPSTPSTLSPASTRARNHSLADPTLNGRSWQETPLNGEDKSKFPHQQTYRQYKEALRQQRQQDVYRRADLTPPSPDSPPPRTSTPAAPAPAAASPLTDCAKRPVQKVIPCRNNKGAPVNGHAATPVSSNGHAAPELEPALSFTMRRELDKHKEESHLIQQLRTTIESRLKMSLESELESVLSDGVVLCHLANQLRPRAVPSVHVPTCPQPKLSMARRRRNVDNFLTACRALGVDEKLMCCATDVLEGRGLVRVAITVAELVRLTRKAPGARKFT